MTRFAGGRAAGGRRDVERARAASAQQPTPTQGTCRLTQKLPPPGHISFTTPSPHPRRTPPTLPWRSRTRRGGRCTSAWARAPSGAWPRSFTSASTPTRTSGSSGCCRRWVLAGAGGAGATSACKQVTPRCSPRRPLAAAPRSWPPPIPAGTCLPTAPSRWRSATTGAAPRPPACPAAVAALAARGRPRCSACLPAPRAASSRQPHGSHRRRRRRRCPAGSSWCSAAAGPCSTRSARVGAGRCAGRAAGLPASRQCGAALQRHASLHPRMERPRRRRSLRRPCLPPGHPALPRRHAPHDCSLRSTERYMGEKAELAAGLAAQGPSPAACCAPHPPASVPARRRRSWLLQPPPTAASPQSTWMPRWGRCRSSGARCRCSAGRRRLPAWRQPPAGVLKEAASSLLPRASHVRPALTRTCCPRPCPNRPASEDDRRKLHNYFL